LSIAFDNSETAILARVLEPESGTLTPETARYFLSAKFPPEDVARMNLLAEKSRRGEISEKVRHDLENYCHIGDLLGILQSKARMILRK
jgi:hypothetical protein